MLLLVACTTPLDSDTGPKPELGIATSEPGCGPTDGLVREFHLDSDTCEVGTEPPRATLQTTRYDLEVGDHFSIAERTLYVWWSGDQPDPTTATLDVVAIDGDVVTFDWSIDAESGAAEAQFCDRPDLICG